MELGERKQKILAAIIDAYIQTGEPVGSKTLVEMLDNAVSSATIRNDMADLAAAGYLEQPHTSAGRIPTARAFRLYIDSLMHRQPLSEKRRRDIEDMLECQVNLQLWVKVKKDWRDSDFLLKNFGYNPADTRPDR